MGKELKDEKELFAYSEAQAEVTAPNLDLWSEQLFRGDSGAGLCLIPRVLHPKNAFALILCEQRGVRCVPGSRT